MPSIDYIVNTSQGPSLADDSPSGLPKEAIFESKFGESIPVSYTCSGIDAADGISRTAYLRGAEHYRAASG